MLDLNRLAKVWRLATAPLPVKLRQPATGLLAWRSMMLAAPNATCLPTYTGRSRASCWRRQSRTGLQTVKDGIFTGC